MVYTTPKTKHKIDHTLARPRHHHALANKNAVQHHSKRSRARPSCSQKQCNTTPKVYKVAYSGVMEPPPPTTASVLAVHEYLVVVGGDGHTA